MSKQEVIGNTIRAYFRDEKISLTSVADILGVSLPAVTNLLSGKRNFGLNTAKKWHEAFGFSETYLRTGEGTLLGDMPLPVDDGSVLPGKVIPFYDVEAAAGQQYGMDMAAKSAAIAMIEIGNVLNDSEVAIRVYGNSMVPNYPAGCVIGVKITHESFIVPGHVYVVETADNRYLKRLYYSKDKKALRCISDNTMVHDSGSMKGEYIYPEFEIPFAEVRQMWQVVGVIKRNLM